MRLSDLRRSSNLEDRRGQGGGFGGPMGLGGFPIFIPRSMGGAVLLLVMFGVYYFSQRASAPTDESASHVAEDGADSNRDFVAAVLGDTEDTWKRIFESRGARYAEPTLVLFDGRVRSACGLASSAVGPFYCPGDRKVYLDLSFFRELSQRFGAPGDFAQAYVIAHEIGHHVQELQGGHPGAGSRGPESGAVRTELQADCYAGVWAHSAQQRGVLETGDVEEGLRAATAIGDDRLQQQAQGYVVPESFTHGTSQQRVEWFRRGMQSGNVESCDTFSGPI